MHELSVAQRLVDRAAETAATHGAQTVTAMTIEVGRATHLNPNQLRGCVRLVAADTPVERASIRVESADPRGECGCGWNGTPDTVSDAVTYVPDPTCPECGDRVTLTRGQGCRLRSIDVPERDETQAAPSERP